MQRLVSKNFYVTLLVIFVLLAVLWYFGSQYFNLPFLKSHLRQIQDFHQSHIYWTLTGYALLYVVAAAFAVPGAAPLTLLGGLLFGLVQGTLIVSLASTFGSTLAFLISRHFFKKRLEEEYSGRAKKLKQKVDRYGAHYLFFLRLNPVIPFFMINTLMGLTNMRTWTFFWVSQVGMLPGTVIFVNAGQQLGQIQSPMDLLSPTVLVSLTLVGLLPLVLQKLSERWAPNKEDQDLT